MIDEGDCGAIGGMKIGRRNRSTRRKPAPAPLCPPQTPHDPEPGRRGGKPATIKELSKTVLLVMRLESSGSEVPKLATEHDPEPVQCGNNFWGFHLAHMLRKFNTFE
jgi:hypothetical protein